MYNLILEKAEEPEIKLLIYQTTLPVSWRAGIQDKNQQLELDIEQETDVKLEKK